MRKAVTGVIAMLVVGALLLVVGLTSPIGGTVVHAAGPYTVTFLGTDDAVMHTVTDADDTDYLYDLAPAVTATAPEGHRWEWQVRGGSTPSYTWTAFTIVENGAQVTGDMTFRLRAVAQTFTLTIMGDTTIGPAQTTFNSPVNAGMPNVRPGNTAGGGYTRGYIFDGWFEQGTDTRFESTFMMPARNLTLVMRWTPRVITTQETQLQLLLTEAAGLTNADFETTAARDNFRMIEAYAAGRLASIRTDIYAHGLTDAQRTAMDAEAAQLRSLMIAMFETFVIDGDEIVYDVTGEGTNGGNDNGNNNNNNNQNNNDDDTDHVTFRQVLPWLLIAMLVGALFAIGVIMVRNRRNSN